MTVTSLHKPKNVAASYEKKGLSVTASAGTPVIWVYGTIGSTEWAEGFSKDDFKAAMQTIPATAKNIEIRISSEGGCADTGMAVYSVLAAHRARKTVYVDGFACSAASLIAMAGDEVRMADGGMFMIHNAIGYIPGFYGNAAELDEYAAYIPKAQKVLSDISAGYARAYVAKTGKPLDKIQQWMDDETWFTAQEAKEAGFCDVIDTRLKMVACANVEKAGYKKAPQINASPKSMSATILQTLREIAHVRN